MRHETITKCLDDLLAMTEKADRATFLELAHLTSDTAEAFAQEAQVRATVLRLRTWDLENVKGADFAAELHLLWKAALELFELIEPE